MNVRQFKAVRCSLRHLWQVVPVSSSHGKSSASDAASRTSASQGLTIRQFHPQGSLSGRGSIRGLTLLQNDLHIAILGGDSVVKLFNRFTLTLENAIKCAHDFDVNAMAFNQSGELLVTCRCVGVLLSSAFVVDQFGSRFNCTAVYFGIYVFHQLHTFKY